MTRREFIALLGTSDVAARGARAARQADATPAKFPSVKSWKEGGVSYAGDIVTHDGNTYQARRETAQAPGAADWTCVARAGRDGESLTVRGTYDPRDTYAHSTLWRTTVPASARARARPVPAQAPTGSCWRRSARPARAASAASWALGASAARRRRPSDLGRLIVRATLRRR